MLAVIAAWGVTAPAQAALTFDLANSSVIYAHDLDDTNAPAAEVTGNLVPTKAGSPGFKYSKTKSSGTLSSTAKGGVGYTTTTTSAAVVFQSGTLLTQSDPNNITQGFSTFVMNFSLEWDITSSPFGPPISTNFSLPVQASVGPGGIATASVDINWVSTQRGVLRPAFNGTLTFDNTLGTTTLNQLGSLTSSMASTLIPPQLAVGDSLTLSGIVTFTAKNEHQPTTIGLDPTAGAFHINTFDQDLETGSPRRSLDASPERGTDNGYYVPAPESNFNLVDGISGLAPEFDGANFIYTPEVSDFNHDFAINFHFKTDSTPPVEECEDYYCEGDYATRWTMLHLFDESFNSQIEISIDSYGNILATVVDGASETYGEVGSWNTERNWADNEWHQFLLTAERDEENIQTLLSLFIDGELVDSLTMYGLFGAATDLDMVLGASAFPLYYTDSLTNGPSLGFSNHYQGLLDELFLFDYPEQRQVLVGAPGYDPNNPTPQGLAAEAGESEAIPEPATFVLSSLALAGLGLLSGGRSRRRASRG